MPAAPGTLTTSHPMALQNEREEGLEIESMEGLAEKWESCLAIRQRARKLGSLLEWISADATGIPSMILLCIWGFALFVRVLTLSFSFKKL